MHFIKRLLQACNPHFTLLLGFIREAAFRAKETSVGSGKTATLQTV